MSDKKEQFLIKIDKALDVARESLRLHGGNVELVDFDLKSKVVKVRLHGSCALCPLAQMTLKNVVEASLQEQIPEITAVESVD